MENEIRPETTFAEKAKKKIRSFFRWTIAILVVVLVAGTLFLVYATYSEGVRAGTVLKVSKRGLLFKTYEGQLDLDVFGATANKENLFDQSFKFSVKDAAVISQLEAVALTGERVNLRYEEKYMRIPFLGETKYFVTGVERKAD
jgi:hypothetical protein